jgi:Holliday junction resolvase RusA-like endonuclease
MEKNTLEFKLNIAPQSHQSFKIGRNGIKYKPKKVVDYQAHIRKMVTDQLPSDFSIITAGTPIVVEYIHYIYAYPKSMPKYKRVYSTPKTTKPDLQDNLNKAFFDALEGLIYEQDQNIVEIKSMRKYYSEENKVKVRFVY